MKTKTLLIDCGHYAVAVGHFMVAAAAAQAHDKLVAAALAQHGDHGPRISGVIRDHFPERTKDRLRALCRQISAEVDAAYAARPPHTRMVTMRTIGRQVAARHGQGFYGVHV